MVLLFFLCSHIIFGHLCPTVLECSSRNEVEEICLRGNDLLQWKAQTYDLHLCQNLILPSSSKRDTFLSDSSPTDDCLFLPFSKSPLAVRLAWRALGLFYAKPNQVRVRTWVVTVVTWICRNCYRCYMFSPLPNENKLVFDLHLLIGFWKELNKVQRLNALGPLCLWHCL